MSTESLIERLAELGLDKYDPKRKAKRAEVRKERARAKNKSAQAQKEKSQAEREKSFSQEEIVAAKANGSTKAFEQETASLPPEEVEIPPAVKRSRYISTQERHEVARRNEDEGCCYVDPSSGKRCGSMRYLELDHIEPFAEGGSNTAENLRPMCGAHNRWRVGAVTT